MKALQGVMNLQLFAIDYATKYSGIVDEKFKEGSKSDTCVNQDYSFAGGNIVKVHTIGVPTLNNYDRDGATLRYGAVETLSLTSQSLTMSQDKSFTFSIDTMDMDETAMALTAGTALDRTIREVIVPTVDTYRFATMVTGAGTSATPAVLTASTVYDAILTATETLDDNEVPMDGRIIVVNPEVYAFMKASTEIVLDTDLGDDVKRNGVVATIDGMRVVKVPSGRLPANQNFIVTHPIATTSPVKLAQYKIHSDAPGYNGALVEGRVYYDAFVLTNKANAIYSHKSA